MSEVNQSNGEPIPYHWQTRPSKRRVFALMVLAHFRWRGLRCRESFCFANATEMGWYCDWHDPHRHKYGVPPEQLPADPFTTLISESDGS